VSHCGPSGAAAYTGAVCETRDPNYSSGNPARHRTLYSYDALGELTSITPAQPDNSRTTPPAETITYDNYSRQISLTNSKSDVTGSHYDTLDRLTKTDIPGTWTSERVYDADGNQLSATDYNGSHVADDFDSYTYDPINRVATQTNWTIGTSTLTWDSNSRLLTYHDAGGTVGYGYDTAGGLTSLTEPGGSCTGFSLPSTPPTTASLCTLYALDKNGKRLSTVNPGSVAGQTYIYDTSGRISRLKATGASGAVLVDYSYSYLNGTPDANHISKRTDNITGNYLTYTYTAGSRLTSAITKNSGGTTLTTFVYCYDAAGNRTNVRTTTGATCPGTATYTYDGANQILTHPYGTDASYDLDGNETDIDSASAGSTIERQTGYGNGNQADSFTVPGGGALTQNYFGVNNNQRYNTDVTTSITDNIESSPLGVSAITRVTSGTPGTPTYITRDPYGNLVGLRIGSAHYYYETDNQQTVLRLITSTGTTANSYTYDPYGQTTDTETITQPFGYTSGYLDWATGLVKLGARYYDPTLGTFTQPDPKTHPTDPNQSSPYPYTGNDPINNIDPSGLGFWNDVASVGFNILLAATIAVECSAIIVAGGGPEDPAADAGCAVVAGATAGAFDKWAE
jgi:RHS repeat-associated protein